MSHQGILYIVPTPIGNLQDITYRALSVLKEVDVIIVEDTRRTGVLLNFFSIQKPCIVLHKYNESKVILKLIEKLRSGLCMALVSDAGTPLISDPGYIFVKRCRILKIKVVPLPGACAAITALSASGLPANRFCFEGFLSSKKSLRLERLKFLEKESRTLIFYDTKYHLINTLKDMADVFGNKRRIVLARELTKKWESFYESSIRNLLSWIEEGLILIQGEIVLIVEGFCIKDSRDFISEKNLYTMKFLTSFMSLKQAAILTSKIYGIKKNLLYRSYLKKLLD